VQLTAPHGSVQGISAICPQVALFSAELERYDAAIPIFEDTARAAVQNNLLKFSARGHLLNAGICHLCSALPLLQGLLHCHIFGPVGK